MKGRHSKFSCRWLSIILGLVWVNLSVAQSKVQVVDENKEPLIGVYISYDNQVNTTDNLGYFQFPSELSKQTIFSFQYVGYNDLNLSLADIEYGLPYVQMTPNDNVLEEVTVIGRTDASEIELPYNISRVKAKNIFSNNVQTSADAIELSGGAYIQKSQMGGGSPILRGFEANKILLVVDGVRMNNAIYRNGHLQNAITIDPSILQQAEVIFGPGSLLYGSEALGGVIHFRTKSPLLNLTPDLDKKENLNLVMRYNNANHEKMLHIDHLYSNKKFGVLTSVSFSDYGDLRAGSRRSEAYPDLGRRENYVIPRANQDSIAVNDNPNVQIGTAYNQFDLMQKYVFSLSEKVKLEFNLQYSSTGDVPRYDNLSEMQNGTFRYALWNYGPQNRFLFSPKLTILSPTALYDKATLITSYQKIDEDRIIRNFNSPILETQNENVSVYGLTLDFSKELSDRQKIIYGIDYHYNDVASIAWSQDDSSSNPEDRTTILSRYPSAGSQLANAGIFAQHILHSRDTYWTWILGVRYTHQVVDLLYDRADPFEWPSYFYEGIKNTSQAFVGITGINYKRDGFSLKASVGNAFRAPNVDDLAKVRVKRDEITIPNPELKPEKVINGELTLSYSDKRLQVGATGYYTQLRDAIIREPFALPDGRTEYITRGDTLLVTANTNAQSGIVRGLSLSLKYNILPSLVYESSYNIAKGTAKDEDNVESPLAHIPPAFGHNRVSYRQPKFALSFDHKYNGWKPIDEYGGSVDNPDLATVDGSPSWHVYGISVQFFPLDLLTVNVALNNLMDSHYRPFASGVSGPGRHFILSAKYSLE